MKKHKKKEQELPELVTVMAKFVERLDTLDKKIDQIIGRLVSLPLQMMHVFQELQRSVPVHHIQPSQRQEHNADNRRERVMYKAVCADCCKNCEVPFKPTEDRPVYCKECFTIRKAGHVPQDPDKRVAVFPSQKKALAAPPTSAAVSKSKKQKAVTKSGKKPAKKKKK